MRRAPGRRPEQQTRTNKAANKPEQEFEAGPEIF